MSNWLDQFECLDVVGNGSFGVIRKVRRKADGQVFARKDLDFSRMTERDRRQIVAEVNILKDLNSPHIVRYHDRYVDRDAGTLYILMEYCGGGDLSAVIKRAARDAERAGVQRGLDEDKVWAFLMQILRALAYCHHPNSSSASGGSGHTRSNSLGGSEGETKRSPILHRDLKPDNVFLDEQNNVKLGDFGLSKALQQAAFANTYVGTPYYMSPEVMQEKAYDSKSDIWSLGCLVYEMCALKPPFHEAKTHAELSAFIRNGRIPPLPRGYSSSLSATIKAMLNLNPAMRPSAIQLLQHERIDYAVKVEETEKLIANVKAHKSAIVQREREVAAREQALVQREVDVEVHSQRLAEAQGEIARLQGSLAAAQDAPQRSQLDNAAVEARVRGAVEARENELRAAIRKHEEQVRAAMAAREAELLSAVHTREEELQAAWIAREEGVRAAHDAALAETRALAERARMARETEIAQAWRDREEEVARDWEAREEEIRREVETREREVENIWQEREQEIEKEWEARLALAVANVQKGSKRLHSPLDDVQNLDISSAADISASSAADISASSAADISASTATDDESAVYETPTAPRTVRPLSAVFQTPAPALRGSRRPQFKTPLPALTQRIRVVAPPSPSEPTINDGVPKGGVHVPGSAMRGVVLTATGESLTTPCPADFVRMFARPLRGVALDFGSVFDEGYGTETNRANTGVQGDSDVDEDEAGNVTVTEVTPRVGANGPQAALVAPSSPGGRLRTRLTPAAPLSPSKASATRGRPLSPTRRSKTAKLSAPSMRRAQSSTVLKKTNSQPLTGRLSAGAIGILGEATHLRRQSSVAPDIISTSGLSSKSTSASSVSTSNSSSGSDVTCRTANSTEQVPAAAPRKLTKAATFASIDPVPASAAEYNLDDEENLPSPFLRKIDREKFAATAASRVKASSSSGSSASAVSAPTRAGMATRSKSAAVPSTSTAAAARRGSNTGHLLRAVAAANAAAGPGKAELSADRPAIASARRATEIARQRLKA